MTPPHPSSALPPLALYEAVPKGISGRASYLQVCLVFRSDPRVITTFFNRLLFGPPQGLTPASACPWIDHLGFGSMPRDCTALFRLAFAQAPGFPSLSLAAQHNSQAHSTKGTPPPSRAVTSCRSMVSGSISLPSQGFFSPFPHGTRSLSVGAEYLALDRGRPGFGQGSSCPALLRQRIMKSLSFRVRGSHALRRAFPCPSATIGFSPNFTGHPHAPLQPRMKRFGLLRFRSPLLTESLLISFPGLLRWFTSPGVAPRHYFIHAPRCLP